MEIPIWCAGVREQNLTSPLSQITYVYFDFCVPIMAEAHFR